MVAASIKTKHLPQAAMKSNRLVLLVLAFCAIAPAVCAQPDTPAVRLRGIVTFSTNQLALLEKSPRQPWEREPTDLILSVGQRDGEIEVVEIDVSAGKVKLHTESKAEELALPPASDASLVEPGQGSANHGDLQDPANIRLAQAGPRLVFRLYQMLVGRSLIRPSSLPSFQLDLYSEKAVTVGDVLAGVESALQAKGILFWPDGDKFIIAGRDGDQQKITPEVRENAAKLAARQEPSAHHPPASASSATSAPAPAPDELLPAGVINFPNTDLNQVLQIFQELANRTLIRPFTLPAPAISFRTYTPLSRSEAIYAFTAMLALNDLSTWPAGDKLMMVFPTFQTNNAAALLARKMPAIPAISTELLAPAQPGGPQFDTRQVQEIYERLTGRTFESEPSLTRPVFTLKLQTALTPTEALCALDLLLGWGGLAVVPEDDGKTARLVRIDSLAGPKGNRN